MCKTTFCVLVILKTATQNNEASQAPLTEFLIMAFGLQLRDVIPITLVGKMASALSNVKNKPARLE